MTWWVEPKRVSPRMHAALIAIRRTVEDALVTYPVTVEIHDPPEHVTFATLAQFRATMSL